MSGHKRILIAWGAPERSSNSALPCSPRELFLQLIRSPLAESPICKLMRSPAIVFSIAGKRVNGEEGVMGALTNDMTRLCDAINGMRNARSAMIRQLEQATKDRRAAVSEMQAGFSSAHREMSRQARSGRRAFVSNLKRTVAGRQREFRADLNGARQAWSGKGRKV